MMVKVFLSYSRVNKGLASRLEADVINQHISVWRDQSKIESNQDWELKIRDAIRSSQGVIYLGTPDACASIYVRDELKIAEAYKKPIYLVWAEGNKWPHAAPMGYISREYIDMREEHREEGLRRLIDNLRRTSPVIEEGIPVHGEHRPRNPYKGLRAFTEEDAGDFFGRVDLVTRIIEEIDGILKNEPYHEREPRFLTIVGPSGSGKSSVVMAGLVPRLKKRVSPNQNNILDIPYSDQWVYLKPMRPGSQPIEALARTLLPGLPKSVSFQKVMDDLWNVRDLSPRALHWYAHDIAREPHKRVVLVIDQLEELFTEVDERQREQFINLLVMAATEPENKVIVIATLRVDFSDRPMKYPLLHSAIEAHRVSIPPMSAENLRAVVEEPTKLPDVQVRFEENLVGDILLDLDRQEENLPLLQFALQELFERCSGKLLTFHEYNAMGHANGALSKHAEDAYNGLASDEHRQLAKELFLRLVNPGELEESVTRHCIPRSNFSFSDAMQNQKMDETIETFIHARLITADEIRTRDLIASEMRPIRTIEISHEALITAWKRLNEWVEKASDDIHTRQILTYDIAQWEEQDRPNAQLYRGYQLAKTQEWAERNIPTTDEESFLKICKENEQREQIMRRFRMIGATMVLTSIIQLILLVGSPLYNLIVPHFVPTIVTNLQDNGKGSLRQVIHDVPAGSAITFAPSIQGTIILKSADLLIDKDLTLSGTDPNNPTKIMISNGIHDKNKAASGPKIHVSAGATVMFKNLAFVDSTVQQTAFIDNAGNLTIDHSRITGNTSYYNGGGIDNSDGSLTLVASTVANNTSQGNGGGIYSWRGPVILNHSMIENNTAKDNGGGIYDLTGGLTLTQSQIQSNRTDNADVSSNGGGITIRSGTVILSSSTITGNTTKGYGGGITLLGSNSFIDKSLITNNHADQKGGGLAVEKNSENNYASLAVITNTELTSTPKGSYYIGNNTAPTSPDVLGMPPGGQTSSLVVDNDTSEDTGNTVPSSYPPEKTHQFRSTVNLDEYCHTLYPQAQGAPSLEMKTSEHIDCVLSTPGHGVQRVTVDPNEACQRQTSETDVIARLADYYDPSSWQCYVHEQHIGNLTQQMINSFCKQNGFEGANQNTNGTAYDWKCLDQKGVPTGLSTTDACQLSYPPHQTDAFDRLVDFSKPDGWECWAPKPGY